MDYVDFFGKRFLVIICVAAVLYSIFLIFSDLTFVYEKIIHFDLKFLPLILITIFISWLILFVRWHILTKKHGIHIKTKENLLVFLSGFALAISPVKSGELIKSIILKNNFGISINYCSLFICSYLKFHRIHPVQTCLRMELFLRSGHVLFINFSILEKISTSVSRTRRCMNESFGSSL